MRNSALGYFGAMCTLKTAFSKTLVSSNVNESEFGLVTKLNCETWVRDRRYLHNTQAYVDA